MLCRIGVNMKKRILIAISIFITIVILLCGFLYISKSNDNASYEQGYLHGYDLGYTDSLNDRWQSGQLLAQEIVPYEPGSGKWKYFIMGFSDGYDNGHSAGEAWKK